MRATIRETVGEEYPPPALTRVLTPIGLFGLALALRLLPWPTVIESNVDLKEISEQLESEFSNVPPLEIDELNKRAKQLEAARALEKQ